MNNFLILKIFACTIFISYSSYIFSITYTLSNNRLIGKNFKYIIPENNMYSLEYFAAKFHIGLYNILAANSNIDLYLPEPKKKLIIPQQLILPNTIKTGIIINSVEMRLYYYPDTQNDIVIVFPISVGTINHATPLNWITSIKYKKKTLSGFLLKIHEKII